MFFALQPVSGTGFIFAALLPDPEHSALARLFLATAYVLAGVCWLRARSRALNSQQAFAGWWLLGAICLFLLALNKEAQLRIQFENAIRVLAKAGGWYDRRQPVQFALAIILPSVLGLATAVFLAIRGRKFARNQPLAIFAWILLLLYLALRQTQEWKPILPWLERARYYDWRFALEATGILLAVLAAVRRAPRTSQG